MILLHRQHIFALSLLTISCTTHPMLRACARIAAAQTASTISYMKNMTARIPTIDKTTDLQTIITIFEAVKKKDPLLSNPRLKTLWSQGAANANMCLAATILNDEKILTHIWRNSHGIKDCHAAINYAAGSKSNDFILLHLINLGAPVNGTSSDSTPLIEAVKSNRHIAAQLLIKYGADVTQKVRGDSPLDIAVRRGSVILTTILLDALPIHAAQSIARNLLWRNKEILRQLENAAKKITPNQS